MEGPRVVRRERERPLEGGLGLVEPAELPEGQRPRPGDVPVVGGEPGSSLRAREGEIGTAEVVLRGGGRDDRGVAGRVRPRRGGRDPAPGRPADRTRLRPPLFRGAQSQRVTFVAEC